MIDFNDVDITRSVVQLNFADRFRFSSSLQLRFLVAAPSFKTLVQFEIAVGVGVQLS